MTPMSIPAARDAVFHVLTRDGRDVRIARDGAVIAARVAFGCAVQPEQGDRVLTADDGETVWIVAVLERPTDLPARIFFEGDIAIMSARGDLSLHATNEINVDAGSRARIAAQEIDLHAGVAHFVLDELLQVGRRVNLYVAMLRSVGELVETFADHVLTRARHGSRFIEGSDQIRAGDIDQRAEGNMQLQARTQFITAETIVRVDAEQIHMG
jgi:hypothetical protein